jgi:cytochrome c oxidase cbb3-type subunit 3/ubiquinol-cytochrome c reductase cytochrome c subunit
VRPEQVLDFPSLYKQNCAACHGDNGRNGAAISLANPVYIAVAGENRMQGVIANGVPGKLMPAFAKSAGGMLTDGQVSALAQGIVKQWGNSNLLAGQNPPSYLATLPGNADQGLQAYKVFCARCHGANGEGGPADGIANSSKSKLGSIVDSSYLALISDQNLRCILIAGRPDEAMPDWRNDAAQSTPAKPLTDEQITDIVAWLASKRVANPGQPYLSNP